MHDDNALSKEKDHKPEIVLAYNETKGAVDTFDELCRGTNTGRKTRRWPMCVLYNMLNIAAINSYVIYLHNFFRNPANDDARPMPRLQFMIKLHEQMARSWQKVRLDNNPRFSRELQHQIRSVLGEKDVAECVAGEQSGPRKYCHRCPSQIRRKTRTYCFSCSKPMCGDHQKKFCLDCSKS